MLKQTGTNTVVVRCAHCGADCAAGTAQHYEEWGYNWDDDDEDAQGSVQVKLNEWWQHPVGPECVREAIRTGHNDQWLASILRDERIPADLRDEARETLRRTAEVSQSVARANDAAAREQGWGVIGRPRGGE